MMRTLPYLHNVHPRKGGRWLGYYPACDRNELDMLSDIVYI